MNLDEILPGRDGEKRITSLVVDKLFGSAEGFRIALREWVGTHKPPIFLRAFCEPDFDRWLIIYFPDHELCVGCRTFRGTIALPIGSLGKIVYYCPDCFVKDARIKEPKR